MSHTIRRLIADDLSLYKAIRLESLETCSEAFGNDLAIEAARSDRAFTLDLSDSLVLAAFIDGEVAGMVGARQGRGVKLRHKANIWGMYVRPRFRRRGIATMLLHEVIEIAPSTVEQVALSVVSTNRDATRIYLQSGFVVYGVERNSLKISPGAYRDEELYVRFLGDRRRTLR